MRRRGERDTHERREHAAYRMTGVVLGRVADHGAHAREGVAVGGLREDVRQAELGADVVARDQQPLHGILDQDGRALEVPCWGLTQRIGRLC